MKILVTGGAGFIGSWVSDEYLRLGHEVWIVDDESTGKRDYVPAKAHYTKLNICDQKGLASYFQGKEFDLINHHAAQMDVRRSVEDPRFDAQVNIMGLLNLLDCAQRHRVKKIVFSSSGGTVYGECAKPAHETDPEVPESPYGVSKLASEKYIKTYASLYGIKYTIFRYANVFGPRQDPHGEAGVVSIFFSRLLDDQPFFIFGSGEQTRDFVFVQDVAEVNGLALNSGDNDIFNIGTGVETSVNHLFQSIADTCQVKKEAVYKPARPGELSRSVLSVQKVKNQMHWAPRTSLKDGLLKTLSYFKPPTAKQASS